MIVQFLNSHMTSPAKSPVNVRKTPQQARSKITVAVILDATIQVLETEGFDRLTTTRVAARAGVSVGTMYQYFPNKRSLLHALLQRHFVSITEAIEEVVRGSYGKDLETIAGGVVGTYMGIKAAQLEDAKALSRIASDGETIGLMRQLAERLEQAVAEGLERAGGGSIRDPGLTAFIIVQAITGTARALIERGASAEAFAASRVELAKLVRAYLAHPEVRREEPPLT